MSYNVTVDGVNFNVQITELASSEITAKVALADAAVALAQTAQADAEGARDTALTYRDTTLTYKDQAEGHATTAAAEAANALSAVTWQDLAGLTFAFSETIVDATVYDTTQDYDGGAWRFNKKASWYQEDRTTGTYLGEYADETAARAGGGTTGDCYYATGANLFYELDAGSGQTETTRAGSAEFPAVAYITAETARVIIWDAQTGGMWKVIAVATSTTPALNIWRGTREAGSCAALNGSILVGLTDTGAAGDIGLMLFDFPKDTATRRDTVGVISLPLTQINSGVDGTLISTTGTTIVNRTVNDVAITTLPNAPIDPATGLPKPTIAVATDVGVSVIKDDGTVVDSADTGAVTRVAFDGQNNLHYTRSGKTSSFADTYAADSFGAFIDSDIPQVDFIQMSSVFDLSAFNSTRVRGATQGLEKIAIKPTGIGSSLINNTTSDYSTGWMPGDIKGAWLASTDDTDLVDTVLNSTTDYTLDWVQTEDGWTINATSLVCDGVDAAEFVATNSGAAGTDLGLAIGEAVTITFDISAYTSGTLGISTSTGTVTSPNYTATGSYSYTGVLSLSTMFYFKSSNFAGTIENIHITRADADRSVNANGLIVNGTVTKTAVATGSELVAYSGFSASNYLEQPYNADLDFGTGDFCVMGWIKTSASGDYVMQRSSTGSSFYVFIDGSGLCEFGTTPSADYLKSTSTLTSNRWTFFAAFRKSGVKYISVDGNVEKTSSYAVDITGSPDGSLVIGASALKTSAFAGSLALMRIGATAPTDEQIAKIYNDEKWMFQEGAQVTLNGSSDAVTALAHDKVTDLLHVGTSGGMSVFDGLVRVSEDATAVTTSISANDSRIVRQ